MIDVVTAKRIAALRAELVAIDEDLRAGWVSGDLSPLREGILIDREGQIAGELVRLGTISGGGR